MQAYDRLFAEHGIVVAQTLLTKQDLADRVGYLNARNTLLSLLSFRVVPIVNENDVVAVDELEGANIGDNDNLSRPRGEPRGCPAAGHADRHRGPPHGRPTPRSQRQAHNAGRADR